nr:13349_t:CDS:2 [Entrophospora candida]
MSLNVLFSIVFDNQLERAPKAFCFFQGLFLQFNTFAQDISALCFSIHVYRLIVLKINDTSIRIKKRYYIACAVYTITFTTILGIVASHTDSIQPRKMNCDVLSPAYVRLLGYSGVNVVFAIPGVYFSGHSAYMVFRHLERFRTISLKSSNKSSNPTLTGSQESSKNDIESNKEKNNEHEPSQSLPPLPLAILSDNEDNDIQLLDGNGNVSNNNEYELTTFSSPISPPLPVFSNDNDENIISSYYENRLSDGEGNKDSVSGNNEYGLTTLPVTSIIVNKDNNKDTYVRVNSKNTNTSQNRTVVLQKKTYDTTKSAAKRSITTLKVALTGEDFNPHIQPNDVIGSMIGIIVTSVFCTSSEIRRLKSIFTKR